MQQHSTAALDRQQCGTISSLYTWKGITYAIKVEVENLFPCSFDFFAQLNYVKQHFIVTLPDNPAENFPFT